MKKLLKIIQTFNTIITDILVLSGIIIILLWIFGGISPQTSISKTAYFFSDLWYAITGKAVEKSPNQTASSDQLQKASERIHTIQHD